MRYKNNILSLIILIVSFLQSQNLQAQLGIKDSLKAKVISSNLITDRPDATESPFTIPLGFIQYEGGFSFSKDTPESGSADKMVYNTGLFRMGLLDNLELRLGYNILRERGAAMACSNGNTISGIDPMLFGFKVAIKPGGNGKPALAALGHISLPFTASESLRPEATAAGFRFAVSQPLTEKISLGYNVGAQWGSDTAEVAYLYTLSLSRSLTSKMGAYLELYGDMPENSSPNHSWDAGFTYLLTKAIQLDATIGAGISTQQAILLAAGISIRLPK